MGDQFPDADQNEKMERHFRFFSKLPREIQDAIWEENIDNSSPSMQVLAVHRFPRLEYFFLLHTLKFKDSEQWYDRYVEMHRQGWDTVTFSFPDPALARLSPYHHAITHVVPSCRSAYEAFVRVRQRREQKQAVKGLKDENEARPDFRMEEQWKDDDNKTMSTIYAIEAQFREKKKDLDNSENLRADLVVRRRGRCGGLPVFLNPMEDVLWVTPVHGAKGGNESGFLSQLLSPPHGVYNCHLASIRRIAIEFSQGQFKRVCSLCVTLGKIRQHYHQSLTVWREQLAAQRAYALCEALARPELSDLPDSQNMKARSWLRRDNIQQLMVNQSLANGHLAGLEQLYPRPQDDETPYDEPFDTNAFLEAYPLLQRVFAVVQSISAKVKNESGQEYWPMCLDDFEGDEASFYNNNGITDIRDQRYFPRHYDEHTGLPICLPGEEHADPHGPREMHHREWCSNTAAATKFWPLTTPNLHTLYIVDRTIRLKPGAAVPAGTKTFQGNNCVYAEVPAPAKRSMENGGEERDLEVPGSPRWDWHGFCVRPVPAS